MLCRELQKKNSLNRFCSTKNTSPINNSLRRCVGGVGMVYEEKKRNYTPIIRELYHKVGSMGCMIPY